MAATVKPIEAKSVHQIQSGQVIVDLCSVVKELVENSLDAKATSIEVRFKNNGLDEIEVQDNGTGIAPANYESVALKHHTSKLSTYDDLSTLDTFGFRGEALSSLCALSSFTITTAQAHEVPKGHRLEFEISGKLKSTSLVACQKGTTASVQNLFEKIPVRRKELTKNIKREYGKVLGLLHAYACVSTNVKFTVRNAMPKAKSVTIFSTKSNATTRENISNVYGAKTLGALVALDLSLSLEQSLPQAGRIQSSTMPVQVSGHISRPVFGEGRQTPDRQMFFVNGRPCGLPQISKAFNEVYKSFNVSQSPFIFADFQMDTSAYDVNVSPDKRTILLHNATALIESLKDSLTALFDQQEQTVPQSHVRAGKLPAYKQLSIPRDFSEDSPSRTSPQDHVSREDSGDRDTDDAVTPSVRSRRSNLLLHDHFRDVTSTREPPTEEESLSDRARLDTNRRKRAAKVADVIAKQNVKQTDEREDASEGEQSRSDSDGADESDDNTGNEDIHVRDFNARMAEQQNPGAKAQGIQATLTGSEAPIPSLLAPRSKRSPALIQNAFDRVRPKRLGPEVATITIGDKTIQRVIGSMPLLNHTQSTFAQTSPQDGQTRSATKIVFGRGIQKFSASETDHTAPRTNTEDLEEPHAQMNGSTSTKDSESSGESDDALSEQPKGTTATVYRRDLLGRQKPKESQPEHADEDEEKTAERNRVNELIRLAEEAARSKTSERSEKRAINSLKSAHTKDSLVSLKVEVETDLIELKSQAKAWLLSRELALDDRAVPKNEFDEMGATAEERLSLTVSKADFATMYIVGQFNLGFVLAVRNKHTKSAKEGGNERDELFIIDQHASDEKYNFERLQAETVVGNQRMVRPAILDLTAVEEEIVIENIAALEKNGFIVDVDMSGELEVGKRCSLTSLPLSKEVVFGTQDLDELIHLLAESPMLNESSSIPRPSKVRKMFAMRACRSSIMIGKTLSKRQMSTILQHMGSIDKPWNCPHGRPTMRHLTSLDALDASLWTEGDGVSHGEGSRSPGSKSAAEVWRSYAI